MGGSGNRQGSDCFSTNTTTCTGNDDIFIGHRKRRLAGGDGIVASIVPFGGQRGEDCRWLQIVSGEAVSYCTLLRYISCKP